MLSNIAIVQIRGLDSTKDEILKFNHSNYLTWELEMQVFVTKDGWEVALKGKEDKLVEITDEVFYENDSWTW